jgi:hypothetical protein
MEELYGTETLRGFLTVKDLVKESAGRVRTQQFCSLDGWRSHIAFSNLWTNASVDIMVRGKQHELKDKKKVGPKNRQ